YFALAVLINPIKTFLDALYRTGQDFESLGKIIAKENGVYLLSSVFIALFGFLGYVIQNALRLITGILLRYWGKLQMLKFKWNLSLIKEQIQVGFLIMLNGYLYSTFFIFDEF